MDMQMEQDIYVIFTAIFRHLTRLIHILIR